MNTLKKLLAYAGSRKALIPLAMIVSVLSTLVSLLPFIFIWLIVKELFVSGGHLQADSNVIYYAWWTFGSAFAGVALYFTALMCSHLAAFKVESNLRRFAMARIVQLPLGFFDKNTSGKIRKVIDDNAGITHSFLAHQMPDLASTMLAPILVLVLIFVFDWLLGLAFLVPVIFAFIIMTTIMNGETQKFTNEYMTAQEEMNTEAVEYVRGIPVVKVFQQSIYSFKNFYNSIKKYKDLVMLCSNVWEKPMSAYTVLINSFAFFLVPIAIIIIGGSENFAGVILNLLFFILMSPIISQSVMKSMYITNALTLASEAVNRLEQISDYDNFSLPEKPMTINNFEVKFDNVYFSYPEAKQNAVDGVSFTLSEGKTVALVGTSGGGKTTIARLVPRFWDVKSGVVSVGGVDVKEILPHDLLNNISFVFQNTKLFKVSLLENIKYGNPDATLEEVNRAVDMAQCRKIIDKQPLGLETKIGTEGTYLSGGEQQRIVLARAILKNAPIVVLDEATAFADPENEHLILKAFRELTKGKTVLMIAHRLSSVVNADTILVVNNGKIAEQGTHQELIKQKGLYNTMWNEYQQSIQWTIKKEVSNA